MADLTFFQEEFDRHATDGVLGDPQGKLGYAYIRVSTSAQAEEGRSGLPRQIARVHEVSAKSGIRIPWDMVFADDHTGFEFQGRPELSKLRTEFTQPSRRADTVVIEYLDRLSRNADWHQGYLLDEMKQHKIETVFWKGFTSRVERAVMGAVSQDGMERSMEIMLEGKRDKARSGRITSSRAAYGFMFVDADGNPSKKPGKDCYYAPHPEQAQMVELIFRKVGIEGMGTRSLCCYLAEHFPPPGNCKYWQPGFLISMIRNPLYKGEFYANRTRKTLIPDKNPRPGEPVQMKRKDILRPREEWILVPVPPLVSPELWETANVMMDKNRRTSKRNGKSDFLLTGLLRCAECEYLYHGRGKRYRPVRKPGTVTIYRIYKCNTTSIHARITNNETHCTQSQIPAPKLEDAVWAAICQLVAEPERLIAQVEAGLDNDENAGLRRQVDYLNKQVTECQKEDEKLYKAFMADVFDAEEYAARRRVLKEKAANLEKEQEALDSRLISHKQIEADKDLILRFASHAKKAGITANASFDFKKRMVKLLVDRIILNVNEGWFRIEGAISGVWSIGEPGKCRDIPVENANIVTQSSP